MGKLLSCIVLLLLCSRCWSQTASASQTVTVRVDPIFKLWVDESTPINLVVNDATVGQQTPAIATSTFKQVNNVGNMKIVVRMNQPLPTGCKLTVTLAPTSGTSCGEINITDATTHDAVINIPKGFDNLGTIKYSFSAGPEVGTISTTTAVDVVTAIAKGADNNKTLTYTFSALSTVSTVTLTKTITYTIAN